jgi:predicted HTH transcriptional regulator
MSDKINKNKGRDKGREKVGVDESSTTWHKGDGIDRSAKHGGFLPGNKCAKGRIKGSRNKLTEKMLERFAMRNQDGISIEEILFDIAQDNGQSAEMRFKASAKLSDLVYPKAQSVEMEIEEMDGMSLEQMDERILILLAKNNKITEQDIDEED